MRPSPPARRPSRRHVAANPSGLRRPRLLVLLGVTTTTRRLRPRGWPRRSQPATVPRRRRQDEPAPVADVAAAARRQSVSRSTATRRRGGGRASSPRPGRSRPSRSTRRSSRPVKALGVPAATGRFGATMQVELVQRRPVTLVSRLRRQVVAARARNGITPRRGTALFSASRRMAPRLAPSRIVLKGSAT